MTRQLSLWRFLQQRLQSQVPVMLLYVVESIGSSPGRRGFAMAVDASGQTIGSIGGGIMEHKFVEMAIDSLKDANHLPAPFLKKQIHDKAAPNNQSGMICSGEQTIFIYALRAADTTIVTSIIEKILQRQNGWLKLSSKGLAFSLEPGQQVNFVTKPEWFYDEKLGYQNELHIIGGGHCALALSRLMQTMDFYIYLYEDRPVLDTLGHNSYVHEIKQLENYQQLEMLDGGENVYVAIMTVGYRTDYIAIKALLGKHFKYLGVLGSQKKMEKLLAQLREENIPEAAIQKIHTPIGLPINSRTPEEIAVSIAAEIIQIKNR